MDFLRKYFVWISVVLLIPLVFYFYFVTDEINTALLNENIVKIRDEINLLAAAVEADPDLHWTEHEKNIIAYVEDLDAINQVVAAVYDNDLILQTERYALTSPFEPLEYPEFVTAIRTNTQGMLTIGYTPLDQAYRDLHIFYRWMPSYAPPEEQYLVFGGVSKFTVVSEVQKFVLFGLWGSLTINFLMNVLYLVLFVRDKGERKEDNEVKCNAN